MSTDEPSPAPKVAAAPRNVWNATVPLWLEKGGGSVRPACFAGLTLPTSYSTAAIPATGVVSKTPVFSRKQFFCGAKFVRRRT